MISEINATCEEQDVAIKQISIAVTQVESATQSSASASEEVASTSEELAGQAESLRRMMSYFNCGNGQVSGVGPDSTSPEFFEGTGDAALPFGKVQDDLERF